MTNTTISSVLPPKLESARLQLIQANMKLVFIFLPAILIISIGDGCLGNYFMARHHNPIFLVLLLPIILFLVGGFVFFSMRYLRKLSYKLGYVCPHCHTSLYNRMSWDDRVEVTGRCPICKGIITDRQLSESSNPAINIVAPDTIFDGLPKKKLPVLFFAAFGFFIVFLIILTHLPPEFIRQYKMPLIIAVPWLGIVFLSVIAQLLKERK